MSAKTSISWTDSTWNPVVGCTKVSAGCKHCYAKELHDLRYRARLAGKKMPEQYALPFESVQKNYSPQTQNQALAAILFLYRVLAVEIGDVSLVRAKKETHLPTILTEDEVARVLEQMTGVYRIMTELLYGGGLRLMECLRLRVKDVDLDTLAITLRDTKSNRDRVTLLPSSVVLALKLHLRKVKAQHEEDLANGYGEVELPYALAGKYPRAPYEWCWQYIFPAAQFSNASR